MIFCARASAASEGPRWTRAVGGYGSLARRPQQAQRGCDSTCEGYEQSKNGKTFGRQDWLSGGVSKTLRGTSRYHLDSVEDHWQLLKGSKSTLKAPGLTG